MHVVGTFRVRFKAITGQDPLHWQERLFSRMLAGAIPAGCDLPTGLGKTSVIPIWLIALASQGRSDGVHALPRRLAYIVNRRTVVDQATDIVEQIRRRLREPDGTDWSQHREALAALRASLERLTSIDSDDEDRFLAVSTLRGELADNEEWKADPTRPAIIVGTVDMIGSKLLFSGYGDGRYHRAHHAGLIGQDVLIVHDEAHLTPAFSDLLRGVAGAQLQTGEPRSVRVMELSATQRNGDIDGDALRLESEDEKDRIVVGRLEAAKRLRLHKVDKRNVISALVEHAKAHDETSSKVLIYVRSPEMASEVGKQLNKALGSADENRIALLTGTIRGHERDRLVNDNHVYRSLLDHESCVERTVYLVSTSAGEVGIDLDADHMVCDLTTLDSMIQRLGRVNRRGGQGRQARVDVVMGADEAKPGDKAREIDKAFAATLTILQRWTKESQDNVVDASPRNLRGLVAALSDDKRAEAFSPKPAVTPLTDILFDAWSLTSIENMPGRPEVAAYLHGLTCDPPETYVVWRKEVALLHDAKADAETVGEWFRACRIEARERVRDRTERVEKALADLLKTHRRRDPDRDFHVVLLDERGGADWSRLSKIVEKDFNLTYRTIVLPVEAGGLDAHGMIDAKAIEPIPDIDVAETIAGGVRRERWLHIRTAEGEQCQRLLSGETVESLPSELREHERITLKQHAEGAEDEGESRDLLLMVSRRKSALENPETARFRQTLPEHTNSIAGHMASIADKLGLEPSTGDALVMAAKWHDLGKDRSVWQRFACNPNGTEPLAKSTRYLHGRKLWGYRHEFGSVLEAETCDELRDHPQRDLILHLIAAHHGHARPHFDPRAFDNERFNTTANEDAAAEVMRRFGQLQHRFGRWGLAWLESLLRCADIAASHQAAESTIAAQPQEVQA